MIKNFLTILFINLVIFGCGKSKLDNNASAESTEALVGANLTKCESVPRCKIMCDSPPAGGGIWIKEECEYELRKNFASMPYCNKLNSCYSKYVDASLYK